MAGEPKNVKNLWIAGKLCCGRNLIYGVTIATGSGRNQKISASKAKHAAKSGAFYGYDKALKTARCPSSTCNVKSSSRPYVYQPKLVRTLKDCGRRRHYTSIATASWRIGIICKDPYVY